DTSQLAELKQRAVKRDLVETRLRRKLSSAMNDSVGWLHWLVDLVVRRGQEMHDWFKSLQHRWQDDLGRLTSPQAETSELLEQASKAQVAGRLDEAEGKYLEVLRRDPHYLAAYQGLAEVYEEQRDYEEAREIYEYLLKRGGTSLSHLGLARVASGQGRLEEAQEEYLKTIDELPQAAQPHLELAGILRQLGRTAEALTQTAAARQLEPNNPKILDFYVELSILNGQPTEAQAALDVLREVNPANQKIPELAQEIRRLAQKLKPKRGRAQSRSQSFGQPLH
ncbi:MAG: tetratricopeptide repeat protein, partial [Candidatus Kerfeldbacteria bacterium]|nr:tetratricopeptide repeat protein [Candidatus Kerfeldbacteria bacterium]